MGEAMGATSRTAAMTVELVGADAVDRVRTLWIALHRHERAVAPGLALIADDVLSWRRRGALYAAWLEQEQGFLALASNGTGVVGYAFVRLEQGANDTFPIGERYAELYSLSVAPEWRGRGLGTRLLDFVDAELASRGIRDLVVSVMLGNTDAQRLHERRGLRPAGSCCIASAPIDDARLQASRPRLPRLEVRRALDDRAWRAPHASVAPAQRLRLRVRGMGSELRDRATERKSKLVGVTRGLGQQQTALDRRQHARGQRAEIRIDRDKAVVTQSAERAADRIAPSSERLAQARPQTLVAVGETGRQRPDRTAAPARAESGPPGPSTVAGKDRFNQHTPRLRKQAHQMNKAKSSYKGATDGCTTSTPAV
jgi:ribosomal protein S18 acetylase RimI-like enzyme